MLPHLFWSAAAAIVTLWCYNETSTNRTASTKSLSDLSNLFVALGVGGAIVRPGQYLRWRVNSIGNHGIAELHYFTVMSNWCSVFHKIIPPCFQNILRCF